MQGLDASLLGVMPYAAIRLGMYDVLKFGYQRATGRKQLNAGTALVFGAAAGGQLGACMCVRMLEMHVYGRVLEARAWPCVSMHIACMHARRAL